MPPEPAPATDTVETFAPKPHAKAGGKVLMFSLASGPGGDEWPVPEWVQLCPAGELVEGRDGRSFKVESVEEVLEGTESEMFFDIDHEAYSWDGSTEAKGWMQELVYLEEADEERPAPGFWARVKWTSEGRELIKSGKFRGVSPTIRVRYETDENGYLVFPGTMVGFARAAALTNLPALEMTMLNRENTVELGAKQRPPGPIDESSEMNETLIALAVKMGLGVDSTEKDLDHAFTALTAERDEAKMELAELRRQVEAKETERFAADVSNAFEAAKKGKMLPAEEEGFRALVSTREGLESFQAIMAARPERFADDGADDPKVEPGPVKMQLTELQKSIADEKGLTHEEYAAAMEG